MALEAANIAQFVVAATYLALSGWLVFLNFQSRIYRGLALVLFLRGSAVVLNQLAALDLPNHLYWHNVRTYFFIATTAAVLDFLILYTWREDSRPRRSARRFLLAVFGACAIAFALNHPLVWTSSGGDIAFGPLGFSVMLLPSSLALAAFWFSRLARVTPIRAQVRFHSVFSLGFATAALAESAGPLSFVVLHGWNALVAGNGGTSGAAVAVAANLASVPLALAAVASIVWDSLRNNQAAAASWQVILPLVVLVLPMVSRAFGSEPHTLIFFSAIPRIVAPALLAYALARQLSSGLDVFRLDRRAGFTLRRGTVGGLMVAFFFVVSESSAQIFGEFAATQNLNPAVAQLVGVAGAAILLLFLHPLNRLGERLSAGVLPDAKPVSEISVQARLRIYGEQVALAWADGSITRKERLLLDKLREQLHVSVADAARLESKAATGSASV